MGTGHNPETAVMAGLVPPAGPKPLRRGEGPGMTKGGEAGARRPGAAAPDVACTELLATAAARLKQARKLPRGPERNELRQVAIALRWLAVHKLSPERAQQLREMLQRETERG